MEFSKPQSPENKLPNNFHLCCTDKESQVENWRTISVANARLNHSPEAVMGFFSECVENEL